MIHQPSTNQDKTKLKVCGLTQLNQIHELISMNVDFLGFIFYKKSPRYVLNYLSLGKIAQVDHQGKVGVFVNDSLDQILETAEKAKLNFIQLHGDEDENFIIELRKKLNIETGIIKVIRIGSEKSDIESKLQQTFDHQMSIINYLLFDTDSIAFGGTGKQFDWNILNEIEIPLPYFLSGGVSEENINQLNILNKSPFALDINSKFEIEPGLKNIKKINVFKDMI